MLSLSDGTWTLSNVTETRTLNVSTATIDQLADLLGTIIYDLRTGAFNASNYSVTGGSTDRSFNANATTEDELLAIIFSLLGDSVNTVFSQLVYTITNQATVRALNADDTTLNELADVLATIAAEQGRVNITAVAAHVSLEGTTAVAYSLEGVVA